MRAISLDGKFVDLPLDANYLEIGIFSMGDFYY
jgi:hypothetical protein